MRSHVAIPRSSSTETRTVPATIVKNHRQGNASPLITAYAAAATNMLTTDQSAREATKRANIAGLSSSGLERAPHSRHAYGDHEPAQNERAAADFAPHRGQSTRMAQSRPSADPGVSFFSRISVIVASVRRRTLATDTAFSKPIRTTFVASTIPAAKRST